MKEKLAGKVPLFPTQDKALKKILQERERGDLAKARKTALEALEKWPGDYDLAIEAVQSCLDVSDYPQTANLLKNAYKRHADRRAEIMDFARTAFQHSYSTLLGSFIIEMLLKSRDLEGIADLLHASPDSFVGELTKRGETRSKNLASEGQEHTALAAENELLLGLLYKEGNQFAKSSESLGRALENLPAGAQAIGGLLAQIERELPQSSLVKFYLGLASLLLAHEDKAAWRFFQCLELEAPPLEKILAALDTAEKPCRYQGLLRGEILMRLGRIEEGVAAARAYLWPEQPGDGATETQGMKLAEERVSALPREILSLPAVMFLYCDIAGALGLVEKTVAILEPAADCSPENAAAVIEWLEKNKTASSTAQAQALRARILIRRGDIDEGIRAARCATDMNPSVIPGIIALIREPSECPTDGDPRLSALLAELYARSGDRESAEEIFGALKRGRALPDGALVKLAGEIMRHCGVFQAGVVSALDISLQNRKLDEAIPFVLALYREKPDEHEGFAAGLRELAGGREDYWGDIAGLLDFLAKEDALTPPFRFLQATAHLQTGEVERAVFEFDQILMLNGDLRRQVIDIYGTASRRFSDNATLHLALYHLYLEEESLADAAHHLCRTLELDPNQIRDVIARFEKLVEREPGNLRIWEQMLRTCLTLNRMSLAREILMRAIAALPKEKAAALHVYGARISAADGKWEDALRCIALALTSPQADARTIEEEIRAIVARDAANPQGHFLLGESLLRCGKEGEGVSAFRRCLDLSSAFKESVKEKLVKLLPLSVEPWVLAGMLGEISWLEGLHDEAFRYFASAQKGPRAALSNLSISIEKIRALHPRDARLALLHAKNLFLEGRWSDAVTVLERPIAEDANLSRAATDILLAIIAEQPAQCDANKLLARVCMQSGDIDQARQAMIRIMSDEAADPATIDAAVSEFLPLHETNAEFLIPYAGIRARMGEMEEALTRYRAALRADPARANAIFDAIGGHAWPQNLRDAERLLASDCLIAAQRSDEAFTQLADFSSRDKNTVTEAVARISQLIELVPRRDYFSLGASLLARSGQDEAAERFVTERSGAISKEDALTLTLELAEILQETGFAERGRRLFAEAVAMAGSKNEILKRIEEAHARWADREIAHLAARLDDGQAPEEDIATLVRLTLEHRGPQAALDLLCRCSLSGAPRSALLGQVYLCMDQPAIACAALAAATGGAPPEVVNTDYLYLEGIARERAGDYGRAAAEFAAIAGRCGDYADSRERALRNYANFLDQQCQERPRVLEKTSSL
jgi:tetratricopeptide (TPR) repeat protein